MISTKYPNYFKNNVHFNSVLATDNFSCVNKFFTKEELFQNSLFLSSIVSEVNAKVKTEKSQSFYEESQYALFIGYLTLLGRIKKRIVLNYYKLKSLLLEIREMVNRANNV
ncbi:hypothetical protein [Clostridioides difficile]|uniref:hypothetical protein n=1 Tax=Clostridioides difficile TaxID=1496 RepID=UPI001EDAEC4B|nr:hypothetical protein [Clostridioides difficile]